MLRGFLQDLNTLTYVIINARALERARANNRAAAQPPP
jgi:hypothetical protein